ncbi:hypothetical protein BCR33DRAFT_477965 [Rhizoclosmatium globosum]|uniref:Uncharacterized protein n=1 Tax=Rhizoclosmatium globosum TaxID=329046 RepID=A0A1Y2BPH9_9FUNG|nr:hypothetical protein BCR33DRAFT_477965 [Rhizoclosmatium globosum]|eukprot:ORY36507.1 hypothetical protein BCR33DRAFT_477965 [Rhizoclosmatium globosum]
MTLPSCRHCLQATNTTACVDPAGSGKSYIQYGRKSIDDITKEIQSTGKDFAVVTKYNSTTCSGNTTGLYAYAFNTTIVNAGKFDGSPYDYKFQHSGGTINLTSWVGSRETGIPSTFEVNKCEADSNGYHKWTIVTANGGQIATTVSASTVIKTSKGISAMSCVTALFSALFVAWFL